MFGKTDDLTVLKTLTSTLNDSVNGYREAAEHVDADDLKDLFTTLGERRQSASAELQSEVTRLGGDADQDGTVLGHVHQGWLDLKAAVTGRDDKATVNEVERGEDYLKEKFEEALKIDSLTGESRAVIERAYQSVREGHDRVSALKHGMEA